MIRTELFKLITRPYKLHRWTINYRDDSESYNILWCFRKLAIALLRVLWTQLNNTIYKDFFQNFKKVYELKFKSFNIQPEKLIVVSTYLCSARMWLVILFIREYFIYCMNRSCICNFVMFHSLFVCNLMKFDNSLMNQEEAVFIDVRRYF